MGSKAALQISGQNWYLEYSIKESQYVIHYKQCDNQKLLSISVFPNLFQYFGPSPMMERLFKHLKGAAAS